MSEVNCKACPQEERHKVFLSIKPLSLSNVAKENAFTFNKLCFRQHLPHALRTVRKCGHVSHVSCVACVCVMGTGHTVICVKWLNQPTGPCYCSKRVGTRNFVLDSDPDSPTGRVLLREVGNKIVHDHSNVPPIGAGWVCCTMIACPCTAHVADSVFAAMRDENTYKHV